MELTNVPYLHFEKKIWQSGVNQFIVPRYLRSNPMWDSNLIDSFILYEIGDVI